MTEEELLKEKAKVEGQKIGLRWLKRHVADFDQSPESAKKIQDYLVLHNLELSEESLEQAFTELTKQGVRFTGAPASIPVEPAPPVENALPEIPNWFPKLETNADIRALSPGQFKNLYFGKTGEKFKARIQAIKQRGL